MGDWQISGKTGHVLAGGSAFLLYATTPEIDRIDSDGKRRCYGSPRRWGNIKAQLCFAVLTQEGDDEGIYRLERLPSEAEAGVIRDCLGIRRKRKVTAENSPASGTRQVSIKSTSGGQFFAREHRGVILALGGG